MTAGLDTPIDVARVVIEERGGPMEATFASARGAWRERRGLLLRITDTDGRTGLGEASPLPGYSGESLADCGTQLAALRPGVHRAASPPVEAPAARFAYECALLDIAAGRAGVPVHRLLGGRGGTLARCAVVDSLEAARQAHARGLRCCKIKVGRDPDAELALLDAIAADLPDLQLRVDANGTDDLRLLGLAERELELIEEPGPALGRALRLAGGSGVRLALDESLQRIADDDPAIRDADVLILKPMSLGLGRCLALARGRDVVVSHLLGGPVELAACCELALALAPRRACGLDPHPGLSAWPPARVPQLDGARIVAREHGGLGVAL